MGSPERLIAWQVACHRVIGRTKRLPLIFDGDALAGRPTSRAPNMNKVFVGKNASSLHAWSRARSWSRDKRQEARWVTLYRTVLYCTTWQATYGILLREGLGLGSISARLIPLIQCSWEWNSLLELGTHVRVQDSELPFEGRTKGLDAIPRFRSLGSAISPMLLYL